MSAEQQAGGPLQVLTVEDRFQATITSVDIDDIGPDVTSAGAGGRRLFSVGQMSPTTISLEGVIDHGNQRMFQGGSKNMTLRMQGWSGGGLTWRGMFSSVKYLGREGGGLYRFSAEIRALDGTTFTMADQAQEQQEEEQDGQSWHHVATYTDTQTHGRGALNVITPEHIQRAAEEAARLTSEIDGAFTQETRERLWQNARPVIPERVRTVKKQTTLKDKPKRRIRI